MQTEEIAKRLVEYCRKADWEAAHNKLYAKDAISIEPLAMPEFEKETKGIDAIREKGKKFDNTLEKIHSVETSDPLVVGNTIAFTLTLDCTVKGKGRMKSPELCVYQVKNGKIVTEEFFV